MGAIIRRERRSVNQHDARFQRDEGAQDFDGIGKIGQYTRQNQQVDGCVDERSAGICRELQFVAFEFALAAFDEMRLLAHEPLSDSPQIEVWANAMQKATKRAAEIQYGQAGCRGGAITRGCFESTQDIFWGGMCWETYRVLLIGESTLQDRMARRPDAFENAIVVVA